MDYRAFYAQLFRPIENLLGPLDLTTRTPLVGFDAGGPLSFCTISPPDGVRSYVSCELAVRAEQQPSPLGRYELLASCSNEAWVTSVLSDIGRMTFDVAFGPGHTLDIGPWGKPEDLVQAVFFESVCTVAIADEPFAVLRVVGITRPELEFARSAGVPALTSRLQAASVYPATRLDRPSVI